MPSDHTDYVLLLLAELDSQIDFTQYDANEDGGVDMIVFMMDFPNDCGLALGAWYGEPNLYTTDDVDSQGRYMVIQRLRTLVAWKDSRIPNTLAKQGSWNGLLTHEWSHMMGIHHQTGGCGYGVGGFNLMTGNGFSDEQGVGTPSPYLPPITSGPDLFYYTIPDCVTVSEQNLNLRDYQWFGDAVMVVPEQIEPITLEYFFVTNHQRQNPFEYKWPGRGLMILHCDRSTGSYSERLHKRYDIEMPMGLWNWNQPIGGRCDVGVRSDTANTTSGLDSMDYVYTRIDTSVVPMFLDGKPGTAGCFCQQGQFFSAVTNPNTNRYSGNTQTIVTNVAVEGIRFDTTSAVFTINAYTNRWAGLYVENAVWHDTVKVIGLVTFTETATLTIEPGTVVQIAPDAHLLIEGTLTAQGTLQDSIYLEAAGESPWGCLYLYPGSESSLEYCVIRDGQGVIAEDPELAYIYQCRIEGMPIGLDAYNAELNNLTCIGCVIENCELYGIRGTLSSGAFQN